MHPITANDQTFENEVLNSTVPVLVDFWAPWCAPCRMLAPIVDEIAREYAGRIKVVKMNTDENQNTAMNYQIMSIPTLMIFKNGEMVDQMVGMNPKQHITEKLNYFAAEPAVLN